ncbi:MAG: DUF885 domain-containing protein [Myxococcales bacterium]|nr:DUF885 domain-containing protein [Myxococcales bacterium]
MSKTAFAALIDDYLHARSKASPIFATLMGIEGYDALVDNVSPEGRAATVADLQALDARAEELATDDLDADDLVDIEALRCDLRASIAVEERFRPWSRNPQEGPLTATFAVYSLLIRAGAEGPDPAALRSRLELVPELLERARRSIEDPREVPPTWAQVALGVIAGAEQFYREGLAQALAGHSALADDLEAPCARVLESLEAYRAWIEREVLPVAAGDFAAGPELFGLLLESSQGLDQSAEEILARGHEEIRRLSGELERVAIHLGGRDWRALQESYKAIHPTAEELLTVYTRDLARAKRFVGAKGLATIPKPDRLEIQETPAFERATTPFAAYISPPPFTRSRRNPPAAYFWVTPPDPALSAEAREGHLRGHSTLDIPLTALHEGYPGHHLQFTRQAWLDRPIRKVAHAAAMFEGWALYCEQMMFEEGFLADPRQELMMLAAQLWRACRVVIDVGLHTGGLDHAGAVRMLVEIAGIEAPQAEVEVNRYTMSPTNPLSYMAGKWMLIELREELRRREGKDFRLGDFHDQLLSYGAIPIRLIRDALLAKGDGAGRSEIEPEHPARRGAPISSRSPRRLRRPGPA